MEKILFILKRREDFDEIIHSNIGLSTGLYNSASFVVNMLNYCGIDSKLVVVNDNNDVDREVADYKPTHVIIEALWIIPTKFSILQRLHPKVKWIVRLHSEIPFLAGESMALDWIGDCASYTNVYIGVNAPRTLPEVVMYLRLRGIPNADKKVVYLPNYYPQDYKVKRSHEQTNTVNIACFGAVRLLKNHLLQAFAALVFADRRGLKLKFHVNAGRIEMLGEPVSNNLRCLFEQIHASGHELINHQWTPREQFLKLCSTMDIGMQVSFSETFNIVAADLISQGIPVVGSKEIPWMSPQYCAEPTSTESLVNCLSLVYDQPKTNVEINQKRLTEYTTNTKKVWYNYIKGN